MRFLLAWLVYYWGGVHRYFAISNNMTGEFKRAAVCFTKALEIKPDFRDARYALAGILGREMGQHEAAISHLNIILSKNPRDGDALLTRAQSRQDLGHIEGALADLEAYLALPGQSHHDLAARMAGFLQTAIDQ